MKAKDLMIGDWVVGKKCRELPFKITRINDYGKYYYGITEEGSQIGPFLLEELEPIPLTTEILEKNGWKTPNWTTNLWECRLDKRIKCDIGISSGGWFLRVKDIAENWFILLLTINYVHQLQHALQLCGIEKEIEL